jgi:hypothetical protein
MIVQAVNIGGDVAISQFDLLVPGGGVGQFNACTAGGAPQWDNKPDLGATMGGFLATCNGQASCVTTKCQTAFAGKPQLIAGCDWFTGWYNAADNPNVVYKEVTCPAELTAKSKM